MHEVKCGIFVITTIKIYVVHFYPNRIFIDAFESDLYLFPLISVLLIILLLVLSYQCIISSPPGQNGSHLSDDIFNCIFLNEKFCILIQISQKFVPKGPIGNR